MFDSLRLSGSYFVSSLPSRQVTTSIPFLTGDCLQSGPVTNITGMGFFGTSTGNRAFNLHLRWDSVDSHLGDTENPFFCVR